MTVGADMVGIELTAHKAAIMLLQKYVFIRHERQQFGTGIVNVGGLGVAMVLSTSTQNGVTTIVLGITAGMVVVSIGPNHVVLGSQSLDPVLEL